MAGRRFTFYFAWNALIEQRQSLDRLEDRYPALFEFRRALWPLFEHRADPAEYRQDIGGFLEHVILFDFRHVLSFLENETGHAPLRIDRQPLSGARRAITPALLQQTDTLVVISLDHRTTAQSPNVREIEAVQAFLERPEACVVVCPHHDIGRPDLPIKELEVEFRHHGDQTIPAVQRIGGYARDLLRGIGLPVMNRHGLNPAAGPDGSPAALDKSPGEDGLKLLEGVGTFNLHPHLPHLEVPVELSNKVRVLARQPINPSARLHPFVQNGATSFHALVWAPPADGRAGNVVVCDATLWSSAFSGLRSLERFWQNLCRVE